MIIVVMLIKKKRCNCVHIYSIKIWNLFDPEFQLTNSKPLIKDILKDLLGELKKIEVQILVLEYKKLDDHKSIHKFFDWSTKLIANDHKSINKISTI